MSEKLDKDQDVASVMIIDTEAPELPKHATTDSNSNTSPSVQDGDISEDASPDAERELCRKLDFRLIPVLSIMFLFNALDKGNLGNAQTAGLSKDLGFKDGQYNLIVAIFFIPYVLAAPFVGLLGKKYGPALVLPILMFCFGSMTLLMVVAHDFGGVFALRWFLGMAEAAFFPLVVYYLTTFYRRAELARRMAVFYAGTLIANAFSGLLAFGTFQITNTPLRPWRWLFVVEGIATVLFASFALWYLPKDSQTARFLTPEEKKLALHRIKVDSSAVVGEKLDLKSSLKIFRQPATYGFLLIEMCLGVPIQSVNLFLPQIIQRLGYGTVLTNLYTVAPSVSGAVTLVILAFLSDWRRLRFPFIALGFILSLTGFAIYAAIDDVNDNMKLAYYATFMMCWGTGAPSVLVSTWYNNNFASENQRILLTSVGIPLANLMGLVSSNIFREKDAPRYQSALIVTASFGGIGAVSALALGAFMILDNKRRNKRQGVSLTAADVPTSKLQDGVSSPDFRWFL